MENFISLLMPVRNARSFLDARLDSLRAQSHQAWELIAVDGGSTDGSLEYLNGVAEEESRIRVLFQPGQNCYSAWNLAREHAKAKHICFIAADDLCAPHALSARLELLSKHREWDGVFCALNILANGRVDSQRWRRNFHGRYYKERLDQPHVRMPPEDGLLYLKLHTAYRNLEQLVLRREIVERVGPFRTDLGPLGHFDFGLRLGATATLGYTPEALVTWRRHPEQLSRNFSTRSYETLRALKRIVEERLDELPTLRDQWPPIARRNEWRLWARALWERRLQST